LVKASHVSGEYPNPMALPAGCGFHPRCPRAIDRCRAEEPALESIGPGRKSACHLNNA